MHFRIKLVEEDNIQKEDWPKYAAVNSTTPKKIALSLIEGFVEYHHSYARENAILLRKK